MRKFLMKKYVQTPVNKKRTTTWKKKILNFLGKKYCGDSRTKGKQNFFKRTHKGLEDRQIFSTNKVINREIINAKVTKTSQKESRRFLEHKQIYERTWSTTTTCIKECLNIYCGRCRNVIVEIARTWAQKKNEYKKCQTCIVVHNASTKIMSEYFLTTAPERP